MELTPNNTVACFLQDLTDRYSVRLPVHEEDNMEGETKLYQFYFTKQYLTRGYVRANSEDEAYEILERLDETGQINEEHEFQDQDKEVFLVPEDADVCESEIFKVEYKHE